MAPKTEKTLQMRGAISFDSRSTAAHLKRVQDAFHEGQQPLSERLSLGKTLRAELPREIHADWSRDKSHPGAVEIVMQTNVGRQPALIPLRFARMSVSPFAFYRGAAAVMACDLARTPITGIPVVMDGDAHVNNSVYMDLRNAT